MGGEGLGRRPLFSVHLTTRHVPLSCLCPFLQMLLLKGNHWTRALPEQSKRLKKVWLFLIGLRCLGDLS